jgi:hypothetical protein
VSTQISVKQATYDELEEKIAKLVESNKKFFSQASKYQDIIGKVDTLRERRKIHEENLNNLLNGVKQLPGERVPHPLVPLGSTDPAGADGFGKHARRFRTRAEDEDREPRGRPRQRSLGARGDEAKARRRAGHARDFRAQA